jgi:hypothetical protein
VSATENDEWYWPRPVVGTRLLLEGEGIASGVVFHAVKAYEKLGLDVAVPRTCWALGYGPADRDYVLLLALAGLSPSEIAEAHRTDAMPPGETLEALIALRGHPVPPRLAPEP